MRESKTYKGSVYPMNWQTMRAANYVSHKQLRTAVFFLAAGLGAYLVSGYVINNDLSGLVLVALPFAFLIVVVPMLKNWRTGVYVFLCWLLFEDIVRKYAGNNMAIFFGKDVLVGVVYLAFYMKVRRNQEKVFRPPFMVPVLLFVWLGVFQVFNPGSTSIWYGILGLKMYFYYIPLVFIGYCLANTEKELQRFFTLNLVLSLLIISLGIAQSIIGPTFLNPQTLQEDIQYLSKLYRVSPISGVRVYRACSVFVSNGRYSDYLQVAWLFALGYSGYLLLRLRQRRWLAFTALAVTMAGAVLSGSRGVIMWIFIDMVAVSAAFLWGAPWKQREVIRVLRTLMRIAIGTTLAIVLLIAIFPDALGARLALYTETLAPSSSANELATRTWDYPIDNFLYAFEYERWPYGYGIGTSGLGTQYVTRIFHVKPPQAGVESGYGTLVVEMGILGLILWLLMAFAIVISAWKVVVQLRGSPLFPIGFVIFWYAFVLLFPSTYGGLQPYEDFLLNAYLWLMLGVLYRLPELAASASIRGSSAQAAG